MPDSWRRPLGIATAGLNPSPSFKVKIVKNAHPFVGPLLTDLYELTMAYGYFMAGKQDDRATFDLVFRRNPFGGAFAVCAGISEAIAFIENYRWTKEEIEFACSRLPGCDEKFKTWLEGVDCSGVTVRGIREGDVMFPRVPVLRIDGPLAACQLLESTLLNLIGYASLVATYATRLAVAAGPGKSIIEFGLRRAQGPDGGMSASRYAYLGGAAGTSNMLAGKVFNIDTMGTLAHAYISSFLGPHDLQSRTVVGADGQEHDLVGMVLECREKAGYTRTHEGELAAFIAYAQAFPNGFLALVDTYDTLGSGVPNALCVASALVRLGYRPVGIRLDSGDLAHLSREARRMFQEAEQKTGIPLPHLSIVASNELDETTIRSLNAQGHEVDVFGVGTRLVTCEGNPSLGAVYKLVEVNGHPRIKLSEDPGKVTIPGRKKVYRLFGSEGYPLVDLMMQDDEPPPSPGDRILCCHPFAPAKRTYVIPARVESVHHLLWDGKNTSSVLTLEEARALREKQVGALREDHLRQLNPTPYKVSLSVKLFDFMHTVWEREAAVGELH